MKKTFTTAFNRDIKSVRDCNVVKFEKPSKVKESLAYATDINEIYRNYCRTGNLPLNGQTPIYDENFIKYDSLIEAQKLCNEASAYFAGLPANIKNNYGNSLNKFIKALNSGDEFLIKEGLLKLPTKPVDNISSVDNKTDFSESLEPLNTASTD